MTKAYGVSLEENKNIKLLWWLHNPELKTIKLCTPNV